VANEWTSASDFKAPEDIKTGVPMKGKYSVAHFTSEKAMTEAFNDVNKYDVMLAYLGYDPMVTYERLTSLAELALITEDQFHKDMKMLICWYVTRGTRLDARARAKTGKEAISTVAKLLSRYDVQIPKPGQSFGPEVITLPRIGLTLASYTAIYQGKFGKDPVGERSLDNVLLPKALRFSGASSIIPASEAQTLGLYIQWAIAFDRIINEKKVKGQSQAAKDKVVQFAMLSFNSPMYGAKDRDVIWATLNNLNLMTGTKGNADVGDLKFTELNLKGDVAPIDKV